jgi:hypothetical protein
MLRPTRLLSFAFLPAVVLIGSVDCGTADSATEAPSPSAPEDLQRLLAFDPAGCIPKSCAALGASCGVVDDGCGALLDCGACPAAAPPSADEPGARGTHDPSASLVWPPDEDTPLDLRADGDSLVGRLLPTPADADGVALFQVQWLRGGAARRWSYGDTPIQDARFVPNTQGLVVLDVRGRLSWLDGPEAEPQPLDAEVVGPLALAADGRFLAYARGEPPFLDLVRYDLDTGRAEVLVGDMAPLWCPALSADGRELVFVSATGGSQALWRLAEGGAPKRVTSAPPNADSTLPMGPTAPLWIGDALIYEHKSALRVLGLDGHERPPLVGWRRPLRVAGGDEVLAREAALGSALLPLPAGALEVQR